MKRIVCLSFLLMLMTIASAKAAIRDVVLVASNAAYTGPCPVVMTFTASLDGDPKTIFSNQLDIDGQPSTKKLYGYIPPSQTVSFNYDVTTDAAHAGKHFAQVEITFGDKPLGTDLPGRIESDKVAFSVTCVSPSPSPTGTQSSSPSPAPTSAATRK